MVTTHAVGIDLGTTYSCIAYLNEQGEPVSIPNQEGEISTPSVVMIEGGEEIVGTEALRNTIINPRHVIQNAKRYMGDLHKTWEVDGRKYTPVDVSAAILRKLLRDAEGQIGTTDRAVITVPAQFSDMQRQATVAAGMKAGLKQVDIINEPVAAALCYVLGAEGLWFTELANEQRILVYDLGGGTFDLSLVTYQQNQVRVLASSGDLHLGGIDFNEALLNAVADQFKKEFGEDPRDDLESLQHLSWEVEQCKRSLTIRQKAALICQHAGKRKTYQIGQEQFNKLTQPLVDRTEGITRQLLKDNKMGWAHVDVVLSTGGSSRMPMIRDVLKKMSGRTINTSLSPDQSIAHGATYYAGMLLSNSEFVHSILNAEATARLASVKQQSVNARGLGILIRNVKTDTRVPYYLIPANTPLPTEATHVFGTVIPNQQRVQLRIVESGAGTTQPYAELGMCEIEGLPPNLPIDSEIAVTIRYDSSARVHVSARDVKSGKEATTEIVRKENIVTRDLSDHAAALVEDEDDDEAEVTLVPVEKQAPTAVPRQAAPPQPVAPAPRPAATIKPAPAPRPAAVPVARQVPKPAPPPQEDSVGIPVLICDLCDTELDRNGRCPKCASRMKSAAAPGNPPQKPAVKPVQAVVGAPKGVKPMPSVKPLPPVNKPPVNKPAVPSVKPIPPSGAPNRGQPAGSGAPAKRTPPAGPRPSGKGPLDDSALSVILSTDDDDIMELPAKPQKKKPGVPLKKQEPAPDIVAGEDEFWRMTEK